MRFTGLLPKAGESNGTKVEYETETGINASETRVYIGVQ